MSLFSKKKEESKESTQKQTDDTVSVAKTSTANGAKSVLANDLSWVLLSPRMSEKAMLSTDKNVYVFNVAKKANKKQIAAAVKEIYGVSPKKVNVTKIARKNIRNPRTGVAGVKGGGRKAYVYLNEGDSISLV